MASTVVAPTSRPQAVIVGAGVVGMLSALQLIKRGWRVSLFDRGAAGAESSWAGGGILSPILPWQYPEPVWRLARRSIALYAELAAALADATGIDPERFDCGALVLGETRHQAGLDWCSLQNLRAGVVDVRFRAGGPEQLALSLPWIGQIRNPRLCQALRLGLVQAGVDLHEHEAAGEWLREGERVIGIRTGNGDYRGDAVVLAAGAWSGGLGDLPVTPVRGQMLLLNLAPERLRSIVLAEGGRYLIPRRDGRVLVGSTVEHAGFDKRTTDIAARELLDFAISLLGDDVADSVETQWSGLRPGSADGVPYIGQHPRLPSLWCCTGHYRNGLVMAPASAELLADLVENGATQVDASDYQLSKSRLAAPAIA